MVKSPEEKERKELIKKAMKELRQQSRKPGAHSGYLKNYAKIHFPSIADFYLYEFIDILVSEEKYRKAKVDDRKLKF